MWKAEKQGWREGGRVGEGVMCALGVRARPGTHTGGKTNEEKCRHAPVCQNIRKRADTRRNIEKNRLDGVAHTHARTDEHAAYLSPSYCSSSSFSSSSYYYYSPPPPLSRARATGRRPSRAHLATASGGNGLPPVGRSRRENIMNPAVYIS